MISSEQAEGFPSCFLSIHPRGRACPCAPSRGSLAAVPGLGTKASFQPAVPSLAPPLYEWAGRKCSEWLENNNGIPAVATPHPQAPNLIYLLSCPENTPLCTQRHSLSSSVDTHMHAQARTHPCPVRSLTVGVQQTPFLPTTAPDTVHTVAWLEAHIHMLTCSLDRNMHMAPDAPQPLGACGLWTQGNGSSCLEGGFLDTVAQGASGCSGLSSGSRLLLWPGQDGRNSTGWLPLLHARPSAMRPSTGERLCIRPHRTLTELFSLFLSPAPARR